MPAGRLHGSDLPSRFCRHQILSHVGICHATAPQAVQLAVGFEGLCGQLLLCEIRLVAIDLCISVAGVCRNLPEENADVPSPVGTSVADVTCCDSCVSEAFSCGCPDSGSDTAASDASSNSEGIVASCSIA